MIITSINPYTEACIEHFAAFDEPQIEQAMTAAERASSLWAETPLEQRTRLLASLAERLRAQADELATLITTEMGKLRAEALAEIDKFAWVCDYYAEHAQQFLADEPIKTDAPLSLVAFQPLGVWLAIMPWNFPFWQVFRCAVPAIAAGNPVLLKHASNVCGCALAIKRLFREAGALAGLLQTLLIPGEQAEALIGDPRIRGVSLTGSESAGRRVAAAAGARIKPSILELGGADAFVVLKDANVEQAATMAAKARFLNGGQSCIAAKRFILVPEIADAFVAAFQAEAEALTPGDPMQPDTTLPPLARSDLRAQLHTQVQASIDQGARLVTGGAPLERTGWFCAATILDPADSALP
jgi:succinate-semialdehyde dehydrogenase/glutarate-semialdehyde dehydrogenase